MTDKYVQRLLTLSKELSEQLEAEQEDDMESVPLILSSKINHICGYIDALKK